MFQSTSPNLLNSAYSISTPTADQGEVDSSQSAFSTQDDSVIAGKGNEMSGAILEMVRPAVERLDEQVKNTRKSQLILANHIDTLSSKLKSIVDEQMLPYDLDVYVRKLDESRKRIGGVNQRLQALHHRMSQLQRGIVRETYKQRHQQRDGPQQQLPK